MLSAGFKAVVACLDPRKMPASLAGRVWNQQLLSELPEGVDPCGEVKRSVDHVVAIFRRSVWWGDVCCEGDSWGDEVWWAGDWDSIRLSDTAQTWPDLRTPGSTPGFAYGH
jgi:hypothetical protein